MRGGCLDWAHALIDNVYPHGELWVVLADGAVHHVLVSTHSDSFFDVMGIHSEEDVVTAFRAVFKTGDVQVRRAREEDLFGLEEDDERYERAREEIAERGWP